MNQAELDKNLEQRMFELKKKINIINLKDVKKLN